MLDFLFGRMFYTDMLITCAFVTAKLPKRDRYPLRAAAAVAGCILFSYGWSALFMRLDNGAIWVTAANYLGCFAAILAALSLCVNIRGLSLMFAGAAAWFLQHLAFLLETLLLPHTGMNYASYFGHLGMVLAVSAAAYALMFRKMEYNVLHYIDLRSVIPIWIVMCLGCTILNSYATFTGEGGIAFTLMELLCTVVGLLYQNSLYRLCGVDRQREGIDALLQQSRKQYRLSKDQIDAVNIKCHDLRHQISRFRREGAVDEKLLNEMERAVDAYDASVKTGCETLDVILTERSAACAAKGIGFTCMADGTGLSGIDPGDLYALFGNAMENAMEAVEKLQDPAQKQISLTIRRIKGFSSVRLQNYTAGPLVLAEGLPLTTKASKADHGFGVKSMRLLMEKYGGEMEFRQEGDVVELYILLPEKGPCQPAG